MISLKSTRTVLTTTKHTQILQTPRVPKRNNLSTLRFCKSTNESDPPPDGDPRQQEYLARIMQIQTEKVRLSNYLDRTSDKLTKFAEEANAEIDQIGEEARKELALIGLVSSGIVNFFISLPSDWRRLAILAVILVGLITQFIYEQKLLSETSKQEKNNDD